jgi:hypothetical protein
MTLTRQQITLLAIFALFLAPLLLVMIMRSPWWEYQPASLKNHGQLVQPPVQLPVIKAVEGKWLLLYVISGPCERKCADTITSLRQIHKAAGRQQEHLAVVVMSKSGADPELQSRIESIYAGFYFVTGTSTTTIAKLEKINASLMSTEDEPNSIHTYVLDPMHNVILAYGDETNPNNINKDLKRLLKWSKQDTVP